MEYWNDGMLEYWETNCITHPSIIPLFHYSNGFAIPSFQHPNLFARRLIFFPHFGIAGQPF